MFLEIIQKGLLQCFCNYCLIQETASFDNDSVAKCSTKALTSEIRCREKSRGGLCYEVILAESSATPLAKQPVSSTPRTAEPSFAEIEQKLRAAEERRNFLETSKLAVVMAEKQKIEEASKKRNQNENIFVNQTKEALEKKIEMHIEKRKAIIMDLKTKMKDHIENVEKTRLSLENQTKAIRTAIDKKLETATAQRTKNIQEIMMKLQKRRVRAELVRKAKAHLINNPMKTTAGCVSV